MKIPYWVFLFLFLVAGSTSIVALRENNQQMVKLRNTVYTVDKSNGDVSTALNNLRDYVYAHMNTNLSSGDNAIKPPIQLKYTYQRLQDAAQAAVDATNSQIYTNAEDTCQAEIPASVSISGRGRVQCIQDYVTSHGGATAPIIPVALYQFDFVSPVWSPDLAGWSLVATALLGLSAAVAFAYQRLLNKVK